MIQYQTKHQIIAEEHWSGDLGTQSQRCGGLECSFDQGKDRDTITLCSVPCIIWGQGMVWRSVWIGKRPGRMRMLLRSKLAECIFMRNLYSESGGWMFCFRTESYTCCFRMCGMITECNLDLSPFSAKLHSQLISAQKVGMCGWSTNWDKEIVNCMDNISIWSNNNIDR